MSDILFKKDDYMQKCGLLKEEWLNGQKDSNDFLDRLAAESEIVIDIWRGSAPDMCVDAIMCIVDLMKRDSEIKILIGCTKEEKAIVYQVHNETAFMKGVMLRRGL